jgi:hypothetical protein
VIVLVVSLFLLTEKFRPHGTLVIKFKHLFALAPTDVDIVRMVNRRVHHHADAGSGAWSSSGGGATATTVEDEEGEKHNEDSSENDDEEGVAAASQSSFSPSSGRLNVLADPKRVWHALVSRTAPLIRPNLISLGQFEVPLMAGYLRVLERHVRGWWWKRHWVAYVVCCAAA